METTNKERTKLFIPYVFPNEDVKINAFFNDLSKHADLLIYNEINKPQFNKSFNTRLTKRLEQTDYIVILNPQFEAGEINQYYPLWGMGHEWGIALEKTKKNFLERTVYVFLTAPAQEQEMFKISGNNNIFDLSKNYTHNFIFLIEYFKNNSTNRLIRLPYDRNAVKLILDVTPQINERLIRFYADNPMELKQINRNLFEELIAELFYTFGFTVELTSQSRDGGRDIIALKNDITNLKYLIECKRPDENNLIGVKTVRELFGVKTDEKATKAILATTSYFTKEALELFERNIWELEPKDFNGVMDWIKNTTGLKMGAYKVASYRFHVTGYRLSSESTVRSESLRKSKKKITVSF